MRRLHVVFALALATSLAGCAGGSDDDEVAPPKTSPSPLEKLTVSIYPAWGTTPSTQAVDASSHELSWNYFQLNTDFTHTTLEQGSRTLTDTEFRSVTDALARVQVTHGNSCGFDDEVVTLDVQNEDGMDSYANDFYAGCPGELQDGRTFASGVEELADVTRALAPQE
ncbi:MAG TPA: hypothetical protein VLJ38_03980 [Polyangiaceae bacterium]|nr:hypothetical protein [Polyangiaceae bacterium]